MSLHLYVTDVDAVVAKIVRPVSNQFYGDRSGMITDPLGHTWNVASHVEEVSEQELHKRLAAMQPS